MNKFSRRLVVIRGGDLAAAKQFDNCYQTISRVEMEMFHLLLRIRESRASREYAGPPRVLRDFVTPRGPDPTGAHLPRGPIERVVVPDGGMRWIEGQTFERNCRSRPEHGIPSPYPPSCSVELHRAGQDTTHHSIYFAVRLGLDFSC